MQQFSLQCCNKPRLGVFANAVPSMGQQTDKDLIEALIKWSGKSASALARGAKMTPSTLTRPKNHPVNHRLSTPTKEKLREAYPDFPGWGGPEQSPSPASRPILRLAVLHIAAAFGERNPQPELVADLTEDLAVFVRASTDPLLTESADASEGFFRAVQMLRLEESRAEDL